jgi:hypothetical protein
LALYGNIAHNHITQHNSREHNWANGLRLEVFKVIEMIKYISCNYVFLLMVSQLTNSPVALFFNGVTDKKSSSILIYLKCGKGIYTEKGDVIKMVNEIKSVIKKGEEGF